MLYQSLPVTDARKSIRIDRKGVPYNYGRRYCFLKVSTLSFFILSFFFIFLILPVFCLQSSGKLRVAYDFNRTLNLFRTDLSLGNYCVFGFCLRALGFLGDNE